MHPVPDARGVFWARIWLTAGAIWVAAALEVALNSYGFAYFRSQPPVFYIGGAILLGILWWLWAGDTPASPSTPMKVDLSTGTQDQGHSSSNSIPTGIAPQPSPPQRTLSEQPDPASAHAAARQYLLQRRQPLEEAILGAGGTIIRHEFDESGTGHLQLRREFDGVAYTVQISKCSATAVWVYPRQPGVKAASRSFAQRGTLVDVADLRRARDAFPIEIGERAFLTMTDDSVIQLLLVRARYYGSGDDNDEAHLRYRVYEPGEYLVTAL